MWIKKYQAPAGTLPYQPADNTSVAWNPQLQETIIAKAPNPGRVDISDNPMGYMPIAGDVLQGGQAIIDFSQGDWRNGLLNAGLLVVPNVVEKPLKFVIKTSRNTIKAAAKKGVADANRFMKSVPVLKSIVRNNDITTRKIITINEYSDIPWDVRKWQDYVSAAKTSPKIIVEDLGKSRGRGTYSTNLDGKFLFTFETNKAGKSNIIRINEKLTPEQARSTAFHERLHTVGYGNRGSNPFNDELADKLLIKTEDLPKDMVRQSEYLHNPSEIAAWCAQVGYELGLKPGQKYIGDTAFKKLLETDNQRLNDLKKYIKLTGPEEYKRFWRGLTGTLFGAALSVPYINDQLQENRGGSTE